MTQRTDWRLQFVTDSRDTLVCGNERPSRTDDGRWMHTLSLPFSEEQYREFAAKAVAKGADDVRLSKRTVSTVRTRGEWEGVDVAALAAAETDEDRGFHAVMRGRRRGGEDG